MAIDPDMKNGELIVKMYAYKEPKPNYPVFYLSKQRDEKWMDYFVSQFRKLWDDAEDLPDN